jgi:two-component system, cell cycle response regulator DivK
MSEITPPMNKTVLIIEDHILNLEMAKELLQVAGFQTIEALNAEAGIQLARERQPDLILMDLHLPGISGFEACEIIKSDPSIPNSVIIGFTALASTEAQVQALKAGCRGVISKPINVDCFAETVAKFLP